MQCESREVFIDTKIKIPEGYKCRRCKAKYALNSYSGDYICLLYGKLLDCTCYETSERYYASGPKVKKYACNKCEECLKGSTKYCFKVR